MDISVANTQWQTNRPQTTFPRVVRRREYFCSIGFGGLTLLFWPSPSFLPPSLSSIDGLYLSRWVFDFYFYFRCFHGNVDDRIWGRDKSMSGIGCCICRLTSQGDRVMGAWPSLPPSPHTTYSTQHMYSQYNISKLHHYSVAYTQPFNLFRTLVPYWGYLSFSSRYFPSIPLPRPRPLPLSEIEVV